jgi:hypothetical protein
MPTARLRGLAMARALPLGTFKAPSAKWVADAELTSKGMAPTRSTAIARPIRRCLAGRQNHGAGPAVEPDAEGMVAASRLAQLLLKEERIVNQTGTHEHHAEQDTRRRLRIVATATALTGGPLFLLGVLLHPARDGAGIAAAGQTYGITHGVEAIGLLLVAVSLVSAYALDAASLGRRGLWALLAAVVGTVLWFGLIVADGTRNPVTAKYAPELVHTTADFDPGGAIIILPALLVFPVGYVLLGRLLARQGARWPGLLVGVGALVYWSGSIPLFAVGPRSPLIQLLEVAGAVSFAIGFVLLGRRGTGPEPAQ